jgi:hypothetical protein
MQTPTVERSGDPTCELELLFHAFWGFIFGVLPERWEDLKVLERVGSFAAQRILKELK